MKNKLSSFLDGSIEEPIKLKKIKEISEQDKKYIKRFINGEKDIYLKVNAVWDLHKDDKSEDVYYKFLVEYMRDGVDFKEYCRLKNIIKNDSIIG